MKTRVAVLHGINLGALDRRPAQHYGGLTFTQLEQRIAKFGRELGLTCNFFQSDHEGDFVSELQNNKRVSDATFAKVEQRFGKAGVVDLVAICGYYTLLAMELNTARYGLPKDGTPLPRLPD